MKAYMVGEEVGFGRYSHWGRTLMNHGFSRVTKVNRHGHIHLENGRVFDKHGCERNVKHGALYLMLPADLREILAREAEGRARAAAAQELRKLLDGQRNGHGEQCKIDHETRERMIALVNQL